jgi:hypothetical protein
VREAALVENFRFPKDPDESSWREILENAGIA